MSNDLAKLSVFTGFYKSLQSCGSAGVWRADAVELPYMHIFLSTWALTTAGMVCALSMVYFRVTEHTAGTEAVNMRVEGDKSSL